MSKLDEKVYNYHILAQCQYVFDIHQVPIVPIHYNVGVPMIDSLSLLGPVCYSICGILAYLVCMVTRDHDKLCNISFICVALLLSNWLCIFSSNSVLTFTTKMFTITNYTFPSKYHKYHKPHAPKLTEDCKS